MEQLPVVQPNQEWGMDMSYLTPSHLANFRPAYKDRLKQQARDVRGHVDTASKTARRR